MLRGPLVWGVFLLVGYIGAEAACIRLLATSASTRNGVVVLAAVAVILCLAAAGGSFKRWRNEDRRDWDASFAAYADPAGSLLAAISAAAIVVTAITMIGLSSCG